VKLECKCVSSLNEKCVFSPTSGVCCDLRINGSPSGSAAAPNAERRETARRGRRDMAAPGANRSRQGQKDTQTNSRGNVSVQNKERFE